MSIPAHLKSDGTVGQIPENGVVFRSETNSTGASRIHRHVGISIFLILFLGQDVLAQERGEIPQSITIGVAESSQDETAITQLLEAYQAAWFSQDTDALLALHSVDTEWINAYGRLIRGRASLGSFLKVRLFPQFDEDVSRNEASNMRTISRRYVGSDGAVVHLYTDSDRGSPRSEHQEHRRTHIHLVMERRTSSWVIVHTAIMDVR